MTKCRTSNEVQIHYTNKLETKTVSKVSLLTIKLACSKDRNVLICSKLMLIGQSGENLVRKIVLC